MGSPLRPTSDQDRTDAGHLFLDETVGLLEIGFALLVMCIVALGWRMPVSRLH